MKIEHIAVWVKDLEAAKNFYVTYFNGKSNEMYRNPLKKFTSYFISFDEGCRLELMHRPDISERLHENPNYFGLTHFSVSVSGKENVDKLTERLRNDGFTVASEPRTTGDGYYESSVFDPEGNLVEITE